LIRRWRLTAGSDRQQRPSITSASCFALRHSIARRTTASIDCERRVCKAPAPDWCLDRRLAVGRPMTEGDLLLSRADGTWLPVRDYSREFAAQRKAAGLRVITLGKLRHSNISRMRAAGIAADVVAAWHGHTERMTQMVYGR
jgi:hypothetical protein